jgi:hypothetical protein
MPDVFRCLRCEYSCAYSTHFERTRLRVHWAPGIPRALCFKGREISGKARAHDAARTRMCVCVGVIPGWCVSTILGISRFRVRSLHSRPGMTDSNGLRRWLFAMAVRTARSGLSRRRHPPPISSGAIRGACHLHESALALVGGGASRRGAGYCALRAHSEMRLEHCSFTLYIH